MSLIPEMLLSIDAFLSPDVSGLALGLGVGGRLVTRRLEIRLAVVGLTGVVPRLIALVEAGFGARLVGVTTAGLGVERASLRTMVGLGSAGTVFWTGLMLCAAGAGMDMTALWLLFNRDRILETALGTEISLFCWPSLYRTMLPSFIS